MDAVDEVKSRLSIEDIIGEYVTLKRAGRSYKGLSPFTNERTPSFVVSPEKQIWKDFSSGKGGSMFDFVMEVEGLDFKGALELLAGKAGVDLEDYRSNKSKGPDKDKLYAALEASTRFYQVQFSKNKLALEYILNQRKFTKDTALSWRLGYSPNNGSALITYLKKQGFSEQDMKLAGLTSTAYRGGIQDMFRGRLMIPLQDSYGKVIGFTARLLEQNDKAPKYINTPSTALYDKSRHVYGLDKAKESIRKGNYAVLVEGNMDVIASHQAGVKVAIATAGTALTEMQLKILGRLTKDVRLSFDSDRAGIAATERAIPLASKAKVSLSIISVPSGKDPDELIRQDPKLWQQAISSNVYALDWLIERHQSLLDLSSGKGKKDFSDVILPTIARLSDPVEQDHYLGRIAELINVDKQALRKKMAGEDNESKPKKSIKVNSQTIDPVSVEHVKVQDKFLSLLISRKTLREFLDHTINSSMLPTKNGKDLFDYLRKTPDYEFKDGSELQKLEDYGKIETLLYEELYQGLDLNDLHEEAERLEAELVTKYVKTEKEKLKISLTSGATEQGLRALQEKDKQLNDLLKQVKGVNHG
ncbi:MAG TPA: DNA primase [Candidatus Saccharimonadales bacterium]|nr:DNA primase [Candidatus Saccharimonadales bacterium]